MTPIRKNALGPVLGPVLGLVLGLALGGAMAAPALAGGYVAPVGETPVAAPVAAPVATAVPNGEWTGPWLGAQIGYGDASAGALDGDGAIYGVRGGYDWDFGQWVLGAGIDWDKTDIDLGNAGDNLDSIARLGLRAGYDLGRTLLYVRGGIAQADADIGGVSRDDTGWFAGIGAEYRINDRWSVGGEVLQNQFDDFDNTGTDLDATTAAVTVGFRF